MTDRAGHEDAREGSAADGVRDRLTDIDDIIRRKAHYGILVDRLVSEPADAKALDSLAALFTSDARFDFGGRIGTFLGSLGLRAFYGGTLPAQRAWVWHSFHSPCVDVDGDTATAQWTISALAVSRGAEDQPPQAIYGRYRDRLERVDGEWLQSELVFVNETRTPS